jgi:hypothetical protein
VSIRVHAWLKTKKPPPSGSGLLINSGERSKPGCRAGQQRGRKQQVQVAIHYLYYTSAKGAVKFNQ